MQPLQKNPLPLLMISPDYCQFLGFSNQTYPLSFYLSKSEL